MKLKDLQSKVLNFFFFFSFKIVASHRFATFFCTFVSLYMERHVKTYACKSALSIHRWKIFFVASPLFYPFATWVEERGRKKKLFALSREKTLHESVISSRIKTKKKLEGLEEGSRFPPTRCFQALASLQNNSNENILVRGFHRFLLA